MALVRSQCSCFWQRSAICQTFPSHVAGGGTHPQKEGKVPRPSNPDEAAQAARAQVHRFETALAALGESDSVEARALQSALKSAQRASEEKLVHVQVKECEAFIGRSQNRVANLEQARAKKQEMLDAATALLTRLRELASAGVPRQPPPFVPPVSDMEAEIKRLREHVAELEGTTATQERPRVRQRISGAA